VIALILARFYMSPPPRTNCGLTCYLTGTRTGWFLIAILPPERSVVNNPKALG